MADPIRAAGGALWRPAAGGVEVAVVHRPRYDDWSLPKGKLDRGEHPLAGAVREVREETGHDAVAGRTLGRSDYTVLQDGKTLPKTVRWWAMRSREGMFVPGAEVDELRWLPPDGAAALLTAGRDLAPLRLLVAAGIATTTVLLVRHAHAGSRADWPGEDLLRPLDDRGRRQADGLAALLPAYGPVRVLSAPAVRCLDTVTPLAAACGLAIEVEPAYGEQGYAADSAGALRRLAALGHGPGAVVVCSQGGAVPRLVEALAGQAGLELASVPARKGSVWALTFVDGVLVDADHLKPLA